MSCNTIQILTTFKYTHAESSTFNSHMYLSSAEEEKCILRWEDVPFCIQFRKLREYGQDDAYTRVCARTV